MAKELITVGETGEVSTVQFDEQSNKSLQFDPRDISSLGDVVEKAKNTGSLTAAPVNIVLSYLEFENNNEPKDLVFIGFTTQASKDTGELLPAAVFADSKGNLLNNMSTIIVSAMQDARKGDAFRIMKTGEKKTSNGNRMFVFDIRPMY